MELLVNSIVGLVLLVVDVGRGLFDWADKALLIGAAVAVGTYFGRGWLSLTTAPDVGAKPSVLLRHSPLRRCVPCASSSCSSPSSP